MVKRYWSSVPIIIIASPASPSDVIIAVFSDKYTVMEEKTSEYSTRMQLQIRDFQASDVGVYTCISTNSLGKSDGTIRFYGESIVSC